MADWLTGWQRAKHSAHAEWNEYRQTTERSDSQFRGRMLCFVGTIFVCRNSIGLATMTTTSTSVHPTDLHFVFHWNLKLPRERRGAHWAGITYPCRYGMEILFNNFLFIREWNPIEWASGKEQTRECLKVYILGGFPFQKSFSEFIYSPEQIKEYLPSRGGPDRRAHPLQPAIGAS